jgi:hypothetical protein
MKTATKQIVRYFICWPPPHWRPGAKKKGDRASWYWNEARKDWVDFWEATEYPTRAAAEDREFIVAVTRAEMSPNLEQLGRVKVTRRVVPLRK